MTATMLELLRQDGFIQSPHARLVAVTGGVSSEIYRVEDGGRVFAVKRALEQLRVAQVWKADVSRNAFEVAYLQLIGRLIPGAVPEVLEHRSDHGYFTMEWLGEGFLNWKTTLLAGEGTVAQAIAAGSLLGRIHRLTWEDDAIRRQFETTENFHQLRLEPYLLSTAEHHPRWKAVFHEEAARIRKNRRCLVHGDFSRKNLLFQGERLVLLDCEVAWFGDPAFDLGFLLNHLILKSIHFQNGDFRDMAQAAREAYAAALGPEAAEVEIALRRLLPLLMLARVDGKSPLEYLTPEGRRDVRRIAEEMLGG